MGLTKAKIENRSKPDEPPIEVLFNPTEYGIDRAASYAEMAVPGLSMPLLQYVRGDTETLSVELFLDATEQRESVEDALEALRDLVRIDAELHAPPVCAFVWGDVSFEGVVGSLRERFTLFADDGRVQRARVNLSMKSYKAAEVQLREMNRQSPDRTRLHVVRERDSLQDIAARVYGDPRRWRPIAEANDLDRPRLLRPGQTLRVPAL